MEGEDEGDGVGGLRLNNLKFKWIDICIFAANTIVSLLVIIFGLMPVFLVGFQLNTYSVYCTYILSLDMVRCLGPCRHYPRS